MLKRFLLSPAPVSVDLGLLLVRVAAGTMLAIHGFEKLQNIDPFVAQVKQMELPAPEAAAWAATIAEFFGGIFLVGGLLTRAAALLAGITMAVAVFKAHANQHFTGPSNDLSVVYKQFATVLLGACAGLVLAGPGRFSIDLVMAGAGGGGKAKAS